MAIGHCQCLHRLTRGGIPIHNLHLILLLDSITIILKMMFDLSDLDYKLHVVLYLFRVPSQLDCES